MSYAFFYRKLDQLARREFPALAEVPEIAWDHLISPLELRLPKSVRENAQAAIRALYRISRGPQYLNQLETAPGISDAKANHESVLMAYDFHTNEAGECFLVEVNTNAAGFLLTSLMEVAHSGADLKSFLPLMDLRTSFENELRLVGSATKTPVVAITDEDINQQKMYAEFLMYRDLFRSFGWKADFCESRDFTLSAGRLEAPQLGAVDLVYNRLTDFYLEMSQHSALRDAFSRGVACVTPSPREYWRTADKQRLIQLTEPGFLEKAGATSAECEALRRVLIPTFEKSAFDSIDDIWQKRRGLFFKPKRSHGGKSVYRGESVSRKVFERLMQEDILIQHFTPAQKMPFDDPRSVLSNWKFDLRFFVYADQIQHCAARIYQGQVTNFASPLGGFTKVVF